MVLFMEVVVMAEKKETYQVVNGPGKWDLAMAILERRKINFTIRIYSENKQHKDKQIEAYFYALPGLDSSRTKFIISATSKTYCLAEIAYASTACFNIKYNIKTRKGSLEVTNRS